MGRLKTKEDLSTILGKYNTLEREHEQLNMHYYKQFHRIDVLEKRQKLLLTTISTLYRGTQYSSIKAKELYALVTMVEEGTEAYEEPSCVPHSIEEMLEYNGNLYILDKLVDENVESFVDHLMTQDLNTELTGTPC